MSSSTVVRLGDIRSRRQERLRRALALSGWRSDVRVRTHLLSRAIEVADADRAVLFWVDDYRDQHPRIDRVIDIASDPPRHAVPTELISRAHEHGFPSLMDSPDRRSGVILFPEAPASTALVSLGGDGMRSWFLLVDCRTPRGRLSIDQRDGLMFLAGELSTAVQHPLHTRWTGSSVLPSKVRVTAPSPAGVFWAIWPKGTASAEDRERINTRFSRVPPGEDLSR